MPVRGLTTQVKPAFPTLGKLRKGGPKPSATRPGPDLEYFRFTSDDKAIEAAFYASYPAQPKSIHVFLPHASLWDNWETWQEHWVAGGMKHRCDGQTCVVWQDDKGEYHDAAMIWNEDHSDYRIEGGIPCPGDCKPVGRLSVILPELLQEGYVGSVTFETHSKHDLMSLQACLEDAAQKSNGNGLQGIEFRLYRELQPISTPIKDENTGEIKRVRRSKWLVQLAPSARWVKAQLARSEWAQLQEPGAMPALPEPAGYEDEEIEEIEEAEFEAAPEAANGVDVYAIREELRAAAADNEHRWPGELASQAQLGVFNALLSEAMGHNGDALSQDRHLVCQFLWGKPSSKDMSKAAASVTLGALIDARRSDREAKEYRVSEDGKRLIGAIIAEQMRAEGQEDLGL